VKGPADRKRIRADLLLVELGLAESRAKAQALILSGAVFASERRVEKAGDLLTREAALTLKGGPRFVSRGGDKLDGALAALSVDVTGALCADIGASTGGFTDCLLKRGAARVIAVDVGRGQLDHRLRSDPRVTVLERTNARHLTRDSLGTAVDLVTVDVSFIGLEKLCPALAAILRPGGRLVALVKPQFEAGRAEVTRGRGVIRDDEVRLRAVGRVRDVLESFRFRAEAEVDSALAGPKGNRERFLLATYVPAQNAPTPGSASRRTPP
jgi:23S rRNA (cytidine1920-2'-O)/16S rRNA (cytidine1409-2'-O)-methyltransferase